MSDYDPEHVDAEDEKRLIGTFHDQGLAHPSDAKPAPKPRWINFQHEGWDVATPELWKEACDGARILLSWGERGQSVLRGEQWVHAIVRVAGGLLCGEKLGRPMGKVRDEWQRIAESIAARGSSHPDGRVATFSGLRVTVASLAR